MTEKMFLTMGVFMSGALAFGEMERATPESQGVPSSAVSAFVDALETSFDGSAKQGSVHGFVIVRHGKVIAEGSWKPFDTLNETHMLYSHSKAITATAMGFLVDDGTLDLDERIVDIFPEATPVNVSENTKALRVRDLLTMNVGSDKPDPERSEPAGDWVRLFLANEIARKPGSGFKYDSCATYVCAAIVERRSGQKLMDFLRKRLFDPIGIRKDAWTTHSPQGIACGGWGMNMTTRDLARFGQFMLQKGVWEGKRLLSREWVELASARQTWCSGGAPKNKPQDDWSCGYGFQFWRCVPAGAYRADGAAGQFTVILPDQDMVVSTHAGVESAKGILTAIWKTLLPSLATGQLPEDSAVQTALAKRLSTLSIPPVTDTGASFVQEGKTITFRENPRGYRSVRFDPKASGGWQCTLVTHAGESRFPIGNGVWEQGCVKIDPQDYESLGDIIGQQTTRASGGFAADGHFRAKVFLTGTTAFLAFDIDASGLVRGEHFGMRGCTFTSASVK